MIKMISFGNFDNLDTKSAGSTDSDNEKIAGEFSAALSLFTAPAENQIKAAPENTKSDPAVDLPAPVSGTTEKIEPETETADRVPEISDGKNAEAPSDSIPDAGPNLFHGGFDTQPLPLRRGRQPLGDPWGGLKGKWAQSQIEPQIITVTPEDRLPAGRFRRTNDPTTVTPEARGQIRVGTGNGDPSEIFNERIEISPSAETISPEFVKNTGQGDAKIAVSKEQLLEIPKQTAPISTIDQNRILQIVDEANRGSVEPIAILDVKTSGEGTETAVKVSDLSNASTTDADSYLFDFRTNRNVVFDFASLNENILQKIRAGNATPPTVGKILDEDRQSALKYRTEGEPIEVSFQSEINRIDNAAADADGQFPIEVIDRGDLSILDLSGDLQKSDASMIEPELPVVSPGTTADAVPSSENTILELSDILQPTAQISNETPDPPRLTNEFGAPELLSPETDLKSERSNYQSDPSKGVDAAAESVEVPLDPQKFQPIAAAPIQAQPVATKPGISSAPSSVREPEIVKSEIEDTKIIVDNFSQLEPNSVKPTEPTVVLAEKDSMLFKSGIDENRETAAVSESLEIFEYVKASESNVETPEISAFEESPVREYSAIKIETADNPIPRPEIPVTPSNEFSGLNFERFIDRSSAKLESSSPVREVMPDRAPVLEQISTGLVKSAEFVKATGDAQLLKMRLRPAELGEVEVRIERDSNGRINAHFQTSGENSHKIISENLPQLRESMQNAGLQVENLEVSSSPYSPNGEERREDRAREQHLSGNGRSSNEDEIPADNLPAPDRSGERLVSLQA